MVARKRNWGYIPTHEVGHSYNYGVGQQAWPGQQIARGRYPNTYGGTCRELGGLATSPGGTGTVYVDGGAVVPQKTQPTPLYSTADTGYQRNCGWTASGQYQQSQGSDQPMRTVKWREVGSTWGLDGNENPGNGPERQLWSLPGPV